MTVRGLPDSAAAIEPITVCVPARDEVDRLPDLIADLRAQTGAPRMRVLILDDASTDGTGDAALEAVDDDPRFIVIRSDAEPEPGWTGKAAACARLAELVDTAVLIFLDADVRLAPGAIAAAVAELRGGTAALVSVWPRQDAGSTVEALVQPLLCWSWATTLPVTVANRSPRPSLAVACGQFLVFDTAAYRAAGGHAEVAASPTEDLDIARVVRRGGRRTALVTAGPLASTRMYRGAADVDAGYSRWLWSAYGGSPVAAAAVAAVAALAFQLPPLAALAGRGATRRAGLFGTAAAITARLLARSVETRTGLTRADILAALAHPLSIAAYTRLSARSHLAHRRGVLTWKSRPLPTTAGGSPT
ncbi:glycosyltransferase [Nocardia sp. NEAU-351]|uniref:Glycosyltransferase n=2 Tax=Nocardia bovistercoris TaxID=2785916 RepID=A0A931II85_9NOCA|nr:glycosyltransferase family 2 protein [Nocardia bovistercoris]MBH0780093.1 glycosyltransferase [Nocardia bovistercoris]